MSAFYPLLTLISIVVFVWLGRRMAKARNRNVVGWCLAGAVFPPLLLILLALKPAPAAAPDEEDAEGDDIPL